MTELKLYQIGTFAAGNRLLDPSQSTEQSSGERCQLHHLGAPRLPRLR